MNTVHYELVFVSIEHTLQTAPLPPDGWETKKMANTVRGFFRTLTHAEQTKFYLATLKKITTLEMQVYDQPDVQAPASTHTGPGGLFETPQALLPEGVRRGGAVLEVHAEERYITAIADMLKRCGAEDISIYAARWD